MKRLDRIVAGWSPPRWEKRTTWPQQRVNYDRLLDRVLDWSVRSDGRRCPQLEEWLEYVFDRSYDRLLAYDKMRKILWSYVGGLTERWPFVEFDERDVFESVMEMIVRGDRASLGWLGRLAWRYLERFPDFVQELGYGGEVDWRPNEMLPEDYYSS